MKLTCFIFLNITEKENSNPLFIFVLSTENNEIINWMLYLLFYYLESILNDDSLKEYINPVILINLKYML